MLGSEVFDWYYNLYTLSPADVIVPLRTSFNFQSDFRRDFNTVNRESLFVVVLNQGPDLMPTGLALNDSTVVGRICRMIKVFIC